jgi:hypothetical protein
MSVKTATEFLLDMKNHSDAGSRAMEESLEGLQALAAELGHQDVSADDIMAAVSDLGGDVDDVQGFALSVKGVLGGLELGSFGPILAGKGGPSNSTHPPERKAMSATCDCDED